jgi:DNA polymerase-3 subunit delta'
MLNNIINAEHKPHAILFVESKLCNLEQFIKSYIKSIVNDESLNTKIDTNQYFDLLHINGYAETIKKEQIMEIMERFSRSGFEKGGNKFYIINGVEHATPQAINSLLKFLEEPPVQTYAILTTRAADLVIGTIKSRCQTFVIPSDLNSFQEQMKKFDISAEQQKIIGDVYYSYDSIQNDIKSKIFFKLFDYCKSLISNCKDLQSIKKMGDLFRKYDYVQIALLLKILNSLVGNSETLLEMIANIKYNPIKILLFDSIITFLQRDSR